MQFGKVAREAPKARPRVLRRRWKIDQQRGADLDDDAAKNFFRLGWAHEFLALRQSFDEDGVYSETARQYRLVKWI